jgi:hypothetical protein
VNDNSELRAEFERLQALVGDRKSVVHLVHFASTSFLTVIAFEIARRVSWVSAVVAMLVAYALTRLWLGLRARRTEQVQFASYSRLRTQLGLDDVSRLLP